MRERFSGLTTTVAMAAAAAVISVCITPASAQAPAASAAPATPAADPTAKTPWGEPDLQGIWTDETDTPLQRPAKYANQEFFTEAQRAELDKARSELLSRDRRSQRGTENDVSGAYNSVFVSFKRAGARTSSIVDPPNGRMPPLTPEAQKSAGAERQFRLALLQTTETCKTKLPGCNGGTYDPKPSPRRADLPPRYNTGRMNRNDGPEDSGLAERCLTGGLPEFGGPAGSFRRIVQTPGGVAMFYDVGQGQGWQRNIVMNASPHLPASIRQWYGDSRGHWEGNTLVIDVTNFSPKTDFQGLARELAPGRALDADRPELARICRHDRGSDGVGAAMDREAGVHQAERPGEQDLLRAALHRRKPGFAGAAARAAHGRVRLCGGTRPRSGKQGQHRRRFHTW